MTSLETVLPALKELVPQVQERLAALQAARAEAVDGAGALLDRLAATAREGAALLARVAQGAALLTESAHRDKEALVSALGALQSSLAAQLQTIAAAEEEVRGSLDAMEASGRALGTELELVDSETTGAWTAAEPALAGVRGDLDAEGMEMETLAQELAPVVEEVAHGAEREQQALSVEWERTGATLEGLVESRAGAFEDAAAWMRTALETHDVALETAALNGVAEPETQLAEQLARRLAVEVEEPLTTAVTAALEALDAAVLQDGTLTAQLTGARAALAEQVQAVWAVLPRVKLQIEIARRAAEQVGVPWSG
jgi:hypothetical protein